MVHSAAIRDAADHRERVYMIADSLGIENATPKKIMDVYDRAKVKVSRPTVSKYLNAYRRELANTSESVADEPEVSEPTETLTEAVKPVEATLDTPDSSDKRVKIWPLYLLMLPAFVAVWSGWVGIGELTGFGTVNLLPGIVDAEINTAITLPIGLEAYAAYALYVWLSGNASDKATRFAKFSSITALCVGGSGQIAYHLMAAAGVSTAPWWITAGVSCIPVAVVGMAAGLAHVANSEE